MVVSSDDCFFSAAAEEAKHGFDLGPHVARREVSGLVIRFHLASTDQLEGPLSWLLVIEVDVIGVGGNSENVSPELGREKSRRAVLVDHRLHTFYTSVGTHDWDAAASASHHQHAIVHQIANHFQLDNLDGLG